MIHVDVTFESTRIIARPEGTSGHWSVEIHDATTGDELVIELTEQELTLIIAYNINYGGEVFDADGNVNAFNALTDAELRKKFGNVGRHLCPIP